MFTQARLKLTLWYLVIIMLISGSFSIVIYRVLTRELERFAGLQRFRIERRLNGIGFQIQPLPPLQDPDLLQETNNRLITTLIIINGTILALSGLFGYVLAGRTLQPIQKMVADQERFVSDASHELKTPLTALKTSLEVSGRDKNLTLKQARLVIDESIEDVNRLQLLTEGLLELTQYPQKQNIPKEIFSLKTSIDYAISHVKPVALKKHVHIQVNEKDIDMFGNKESIIELWTILLDNAVKYSSEGSTVVVMTVLSKDIVNVSVKDQGIGIDKKDIPYIFDRFYRADNARKRNGGGGYGLGLSIAKRIVEIHDGSIKVNSVKDKETTFIVNLPQKKKIT